MFNAYRPPAAAALPRRLVLGLAFLLALLAASALQRPSVGWISPARAQAPTPAKPPASPAAKALPQLPAAPAAPAAPGAQVEKDVEPPGGADVGVTVGKDRKVIVSGFGQKEEYDSFQDFVHEAPWIAGLVFLVVTLVFMVPLLAIVLLVWYKMRKNRMLNETMLKLAEKGIVAPAEAMEALAGNRSASDMLQASPGAAPLYEQAKALRRKSTTSDLRKGVIMSAIGFALVAYSVLDDGSPNWIGLVLLFLGIGYLVLWYLEDRQMSAGGSPGSGA